MPVIESCYEPSLFRHQHAITEYVPAHIANADHGKRL
jgi:hypothetical protein